MRMRAVIAVRSMVCYYQLVCGELLLKMMQRHLLVENRKRSWMKTFHWKFCEVKVKVESDFNRIKIQKHIKGLILKGDFIGALILFIPFHIDI